MKSFLHGPMSSSSIRMMLWASFRTGGWLLLWFNNTKIQLWHHSKSKSDKKCYTSSEPRNITRSCTRKEEKACCITNSDRLWSLDKLSNQKISLFFTVMQAKLTSFNHLKRLIESIAIKIFLQSKYYLIWVIRTTNNVIILILNLLRWLPWVIRSNFQLDMPLRTTNNYLICTIFLI